MKLICDASKNCVKKGMCGHDEPHEVKAGCNWPCHGSTVQGKPGKCVPVKGDGV